MHEKSNIRVLIVDDSLVFRESLSRCLREKEGIDVVGTAKDAYEASDRVFELNPDVITLDFEMPKMNGIEFLKRLMPSRPLPVIIVSSMAINVFEALDAGAVDFIKKPVCKNPADFEAFALELSKKIRVASEANIAAEKPAPPPKPLLKEFPSRAFSLNSVIALGASTGGPDALQYILENLPKNCPPVIVTQHMPSGFTKMYAERINRLCKIDVFEAEDNMRLSYGMCVIAAGDYHLRLCKDGKGYYVSSKKGERVSGHCPSVDVMFTSVAEVAGPDAVAAILTGMGADGSRGLLKIREAGGFTIGQDEASCVVYGMPMVAYNIGAVCEQVPLEKIADVIVKKFTE